MSRYRFVLPSALVVLLGAAVLAASPAPRKDPHGVYGVIDRVVFEPDRAAPERVQFWGVFALADGIGIANGEISRIDMGKFQPARQGYLYYSLNPSDPAATRADWVALEALAGTGEPVAFGAFFPPSFEVPVNERREAMLEWAKRALAHNGRIRQAGDRPAAPDVFPLRMKNAPPGVRADPGRPAAIDVLRVHRGGVAPGGQVSERS